MTSHSPSPGADEFDTPDGELAYLRTQVDQLRQALASHVRVDQAIGVIVVLGKISPDNGFAVLKDVSQHTNIKLSDVADHVLDFAQGKDLPDSVLTAMRSAFARHGEPGTTTG